MTYGSLFIKKSENLLKPLEVKSLNYGYIFIRKYEYLLEIFVLK